MNKGESHYSYSTLLFSISPRDKISSAHSLLTPIRSHGVKKMRIIKTQIDKLTYQGEPGSKKQDIRWDDSLPGFGIRIFESGKKTFVIGYRAGGRWRLQSIGQYGRLTPDEARRLAREILGRVAGGDDPAQERREQRESCTMAQLCETFMREHSRVHKKSWKTDQEQIDKYILPTFARKRAKDIERADIIRLHNRIGAQHPYRANRTLALLSTVFEYGKKIGMIPEDKGNPAHGVKRFREQKRTRYVQESEMTALLSAIDAEESPYCRALFRLYLMTGCRRNELLTLRWEHVDLSRGEITLVNTKNGETRFLPLSPIAVQILRDLPREGGWVFPSPRKPGCRLVELKGIWNRIKKRAGLEDCRLHDLRRTTGSWLASAGTPMQVIQKLLGHKDLATTSSVYAHITQNPIAEASRNISDKVVSFERIKKEKESNEKAG